MNFVLGTMVATSRISAAMDENPNFENFCMGCLERYMNNDWGEMDEDDKLSNDYAVEHGERIFASYELPEGQYICGESKVWIITEADRSSTTVLFPGDY